MPDLGKLMSGFRVFRATTFAQQKDLITHLTMMGEKPTTLVIACADLKISPQILLSTNPGELFVITNIGGMVPKYNETGVHGIMSSIEFAVRNIKVENIMVLGHSKCESMKMIMSDKFASSTDGLSEPMTKWLSIASEARELIKTQLASKSQEEQESACEHESIIISMRNLMGYPYVLERMDKGELNVYGWHFDSEVGTVAAVDPDTGFFEPME